MRKILKYFSFILIFIVLGGLVGSAKFSFGQNDDSAIINKEIKLLNSDIAKQKNKVKEIQNKKKKYSQAIKQKQSEKATLNNQMALLDNKIEKTKLDIELLEIEIERIRLEIQKVDAEIETKNKEIEKEKQYIANVLALMNKKDSVDLLEIMLVNDSFADFLAQVKSLEDINKGLENSLKRIKKFKRDLEKQKLTLDEKNQDLKHSKKELKEKQKKLAYEKESKFNLLQEVESSEREYQRLLAQAKQEQQDAAAEIALMEKQVRAKLAKLNGKKLEFNDNGLIWPVKKNVITTYFHDPDYPFRYIFEHPAVDIRSAQGSPVKAAASGYVARVKKGLDGSYGYIMIIHGNGLSTVYGHVSKTYVKQDEYVVQGQLIALSGGMPGTPGAGRLTTGPHLHFEVRLNGIPVDPLGYLP